MTPDSAPVRLFLALWPPPDIRQHLQSLQQFWAWPPRAVPVHPDKLHLTLHFLGNVPVQRVEEFTEALTVRATPVTLDLAEGTPRVWPGGIAVLEFTPPPDLLRLHAALGDALASLDWPVEPRRYRPHVTLARRAAGAQPPPTGVLAPMRWRADQGYVLVRSSLGRGYEVMRSYGRD